jgi:hypothetical protein
MCIGNEREVNYSQLSMIVIAIKIPVPLPIAPSRSTPTDNSPQAMTISWFLSRLSRGLLEKKAQTESMKDCKWRYRLDRE